MHPTVRPLARLLPFLLGVSSLAACAQPAAAPQVVVVTQVVEREVTREVLQVVTQVVTTTPAMAAPDLQATGSVEQQSAAATIAAAGQTAAAQPTATSEPTAAPLPTTKPTVAQPTLGPDVGYITNGGNMREAPGGVVLGTVCPGDAVSYLHSQGEWYTISIEQIVADCATDRVKVGNIGWVHQSLLTAPQVMVPTTTPAPTPEVQVFNQAQTLGPIRQPLSDERYSTEITLLQVRWSKGERFSEAGAGKVYALATMRVKNLGPNSQRNVSSMMFKALDGRGALNDAELYYGDDCEMEWVDLTAGGAIEGCIAFEVPDSGKLSLIYAPYLFENLQPGRYLSFAIRP